MANAEGHARATLEASDRPSSAAGHDHVEAAVPHYVGIIGRATITLEGERLTLRTPPRMLAGPDLDLDADLAKRRLANDNQSASNPQIATPVASVAPS